MKSDIQLNSGTLGVVEYDELTIITAGKSIIYLRNGIVTKVENYNPDGTAKTTFIK